MKRRQDIARYIYHSLWNLGEAEVNNINQPTWTIRFKISLPPRKKYLDSLHIFIAMKLGYYFKALLLIDERENIILYKHIYNVA